MQQQYWTAVVVMNEKTIITDHFSSFSSDETYSEIRKTLPENARLVALIPGKHAANSAAFSEESRKEDWTRFIDPFECGPMLSTRGKL